MESAVLIGLDLGTSGLKGVALDLGGRVVATARADYPTQRPSAGASEQDPSDWISAVRSVVAELGQAASPRTWLGIGLSGMIPTLVVTDDHGQPLHPAITWEDARAEEQGDALRTAVGPELVYRTTGQWLDGRYLLPMLARIRPELSATSVRIYSAKDWILHWLTGEYATDPATATGSGAYNLTTGQYDESIVNLASSDASLHVHLPAVVPATTVFSLTEAATELGLPPALPIAVGAADAMAALVGLGVQTPGDAICLAGTSTVIVGIDDTAHFDHEQRFLVTPLALGGFGHEMDLLATGSARAWLAGLLGLSTPDELGSIAEGAAPDSPGVPTMLAYVAPGEQGALWDPSLTGVIEGVTLNTSTADLARALNTSITVESARCIAVWEANAPTQGALHVAGRGISRSALQELADSTGRPTHLCGDEHAAHSAVGAAAILGQALGIHPLPVEHRTQMATQPRPEAAPMWEALKGRHEELRLRTSASRARAD